MIRFKVSLTPQSLCVLSRNPCVLITSRVPVTVPYPWEQPDVMRDSVPQEQTGVCRAVAATRKPPGFQILGTCNSNGEKEVPGVSPCCSILTSRATESKSQPNQRIWENRTQCHLRFGPPDFLGQWEGIVPAALWSADCRRGSIGCWTPGASGHYISKAQKQWWLRHLQRRDGLRHCHAEWRKPGDRNKFVYQCIHMETEKMV